MHISAALPTLLYACFEAHNGETFLTAATIRLNYARREAGKILQYVTLLDRHPSLPFVASFLRLHLIAWKNVRRCGTYHSPALYPYLPSRASIVRRRIRLVPFV
jgi:hypothetical protein